MLQGLFTARDTLRRVWRTACVCASGRKGERERNEEKVGGEVGGGAAIFWLSRLQHISWPRHINF